jgi:hypothetical protein
MITRCMLALSAAFVLAAASTASAQFETANRAFHNGTPFRLEGRHQTVACASCHVAGQYFGTPKTCYECHWVRRRDDPFQTRLGTTCESCHRPMSWAAVRWDHGGMTGAALNASHRDISCVSCHRGANVRIAPVACVACHQKDYDATRAPVHAAAGFPVTCEGCHQPGDATWQSGFAGIDHNAIFPLVGRHASATCTACHKNNVYRGTPRDCAGCHVTQYNNTRQPNHSAAGFPITCESCHNPTDPTWSGGTGFDHAAIFPLVGKHGTAACVACHKNNVYHGTPRECVACHIAQYNSTQNPNHAAAGFPTNCEACHRPTDPQWQGASFNHNAVFQLVGRHAAAACAACHQNNVFRGTPRQCAGCHMGDYSGSRDPNHAAAGFPTTCDSCHRAGDSSWSQGRFNHTWFPLSGRHNVACAQCHTASNNFSVFSCTVCHQRAKTDEHHKEVGGYAYDSVRCYACHPNGKSD